MANKEFQLPSGAKLTVTSSPFQDAHALNKALLKGVRGVPLGSDPLKMDISLVKDAVLAAATSEEVEAALFRCMQRASYDGRKMTPDLLDDPKIGDRVREDFYLASWHVIEVNCAPFFAQAFSSLKEQFQKAGSSQESASTPKRP